MFRAVLVVDDEASMRHLLTVILTDRGYQARASSTLKSAGMRAVPPDR